MLVCCLLGGISSPAQPAANAPREAASSLARSDAAAEALWLAVSSHICVRKISAPLEPSRALVTCASRRRKERMELRTGVGQAAPTRTSLYPRPPSQDGWRQH